MSKNEGRRSANPLVPLIEEGDDEDESHEDRGEEETK